MCTFLFSCLYSMGVFYHEEPQSHHSKKCKFFALKDAFTNCHIFTGRVSTSGAEEENQANDFDEEQEVAYLIFIFLLAFRKFGS